MGLSLLLLLSACLSPALADDTAPSALKVAPGPDTRVVTNATELGKALQDHMVTNIIIKGEGSLTGVLMAMHAWLATCMLLACCLLIPGCPNCVVRPKTQSQMVRGQRTGLADSVGAAVQQLPPLAQMSHPRHAHAAGRVHLKPRDWVPGGTASISKGRHVILQSGEAPSHGSM